MRYLDRLQLLALLVMRLTLGTIMSVHGYHKVFGELRHFAHMMEGMGLPGWVTSPTIRSCSADSSLGAGVCHLHQPLRCYLEGSFADRLMGSPDCPGFEFPLAAATLAFGLTVLGAGPISIDHVLGGGGSDSRPEANTLQSPAK